MNTIIGCQLKSAVSFPPCVLCLKDALVDRRVMNHYPSLLSGPFEWQPMAIQEWGRLDPGVGRCCSPDGMY